MISLKKYKVHKNPSTSPPMTEITPNTSVLDANEFLCTVRLLDVNQTPLEIVVQTDKSGEWLFDKVCSRLGGLTEREYFGLRYVDKENNRQWLELFKNAYKQLKHLKPCIMSFRVKHYPPDPQDDLKQEMARYFLYLQLRRDLLHGRLLCEEMELVQLAALVVQAEFGDYENLEDKECYLFRFKVVHKQSPKQEEKIQEMHITLSGLFVNEAEQEFVKKASKLDTYGVDPFQVKDEKGNLLYLGLTHQGVVTFQGSRRTHMFKWCDILKLHVDGKALTLHVPLREDNPYQKKTIMNNFAKLTKKHLLAFKCESKSSAFALWKWAVDRQCFFTLNQSNEAKRVKSGGGLFKRSRTFTFSGRCQKEVVTPTTNDQNLVQPSFVRVSSLRREGKLVEHDAVDGRKKFATFPRRIKDPDDSIIASSTPVKKSVISNLSSEAKDHLETALLHQTSTQSPGEVNEEVVASTSGTLHTAPPEIQVTDAKDLIAAQQGFSICDVASTIGSFDSTISSYDATLSHQPPPYTYPNGQVGNANVMMTSQYDRPDASGNHLISSDGDSASLRPAVDDMNSVGDGGKDDDIVTPVPFWKAFLVSVFVILFLCFWGLILIYEAEINSSLLHDFRANFYVEQVHVSMYKPLRQKLVSLFSG